MRVSKTIPQQEKDMEVVSIIFNFQDKTASIVANGYGEIQSYSAHLADVLNELTPQNRTLVKAFLKKVVEKCAGVLPTDIEGEIPESK
jgi:hypothetical protein